MAQMPGFRKSKNLLFDLAKAMGEQVLCPQCGDPMEPAGNQKRSATRDHILPRTRRYTYPPDTIMHKVVCAHCNNLRAACGHCWGAVACVRAVATVGKLGHRTAEHQLAKTWRLQQMSLTTEPPPPKPGPPARSRALGDWQESSRPVTLADVWPQT